MLASADAAFVDENYEEAVRLYTEALSSLSEGDGATTAAARAHRAAALLKLSRFDDALEDAGTSAKLARSQGSQALECVALYRKGCVRELCST